MSKLLLNELLLVSHKEKAARSIKFDPIATTLTGENSVGKSSIIKSVYYTLGAKPAMVNPKWEENDVECLLRFSIDDRNFVITRRGRRFGLFTEKGALLLNTLSVTKDLGPDLARRLGFNLLLMNRQEEPVVPPPAYCFLPFYIDQDAGWQQTWRSFDALAQFSNWRRDVAYYHSGIRSDEYYKTRMSIDQQKAEKGRVEAELNVLTKAFEKILDKRRVLPISFDQAAYETAINNLMKEAQSLQEKRNSASNKLFELTNSRAQLENQINVVKKAMTEFKKDYELILSIDANEIECPTCGAKHENSFAHKFSIIDDEEECRAFLVDARARADDLDDQLRKERDHLAGHDFRVAKINKLLNEKRGKLKLKDIIESESELKLEKIMRTRIKMLSEEIQKLASSVSEQEKKLKKLTDGKRKAEIEMFYLGEIMSNFDHLNVTSINATEVEKIDCVIKETGSVPPRAVLAYVYAFIKTMKKHSRSPLCPLIIDAPLQQEPDQSNINRIIKFIYEKQPEGTQLITGIGNLHGYKPPGKVYEFHKVGQLLTPDEYEAASSTTSHYVSQLI